MSTIDIKIKADLLGKTFENIGKEVESMLQSSVRSLAQSAYAETIRLAQQRLKSTQQDYISSLQFEPIGDNIYIIRLDGDKANATEDGFASYDMKPGLLNGPKSKVTAKGTRYNTVPFYHQPYSNSPASPKVLDLRSAVKNIIKERNIDNIIKDNQGNAKQGIVARVANTGIRDLEGLVKIQKQYGKKTQSYYMTFRRVSSNSDPSKWIHPGYSGANIFPDVERFIDQELDRILEAIL